MLTSPIIMLITGIISYNIKGDLHQALAKISQVCNLLPVDKIS